MTESVVCLTKRANPTQSIQPSVRSTNIKKEKAISSVFPIQNTKHDFEM